MDKKTPETNRRPMTPAERRAAFRTIFAYAKPHKLTFGVVFFCSLFAIVADLLQPYLITIAIDDNLMAEKNDMSQLWLIGGVYLGLSLMSFILSYIQNNFLQYAGQNIVARLRKNLFQHITRQSIPFFDRHHIGSLVTNESSDTETISQFFTQVLLSLIRDTMTLILIIVFMFQLDVELALYCMVLLPIIATIAVLFRRALRSAYQTSRSRLSRMIAFLAENLAGMSLIQVFNQEGKQYEKFTELNQSYLKANLREVRLNFFFNRIFEILGHVAVALIVWIGGLMVLDKTLNFGVLYGFTIYIRQFFQPINQITQQWNTLQSTIVSVERLWTIFSQQPDVKDPEPAQLKDVNWKNIKGEIHYKDVDFSYVPGTKVINKIQLHIRPGEMIGIVGTTGAGKSSLMNLLVRFYDVNAGAIEIDGINIRRFKQDTLHRMIGLVQQEPFLYSGSILDNVRLFREDVSPETVIEACKTVGAHELIMRLKDSYHTRLSERGSGLSAGERQLLSFARILVFQPRILILDEATANLDSYTEQLVQNALHYVSEGRTTLVIAHRLSTIMQADRIIVMKHGEIIEEGNHRQLLAQRGYYEDLYKHSQGKHAMV